MTRDPHLLRRGAYMFLAAFAVMLYSVFFIAEGVGDAVSIAVLALVVLGVSLYLLRRATRMHG